MIAQELRLKYLKFFESKGHKIIPSASLVPNETDSSVLFTTAGMHPLVPYLMGQDHPQGKRVTNVQKCIRTGDIDDVGDNRHLTFFEMMGNWSFGGPASTDAEGKAGYFKKEAIEWSFEFLTDKNVGLGLDPSRLYVTVFKGEDGIPRDEEAITVWKKVFADAGMEVSVAGEDEIIKDNVRIIPLGKDDNFWIAGATGPCGGDTEMFYDTRTQDGPIDGHKFSDLVDGFRLIEIWNDVFMEFNKTADGKYEKLSKPNVDTGMGVERTLAVLNGKENVFETELFAPIFEKIKEVSRVEYSERIKSFRIIADHIKAATFMIADGVTPLNVGRGYVLRRLIRRAIRHGKHLGINNNFTKIISGVVIDLQSDFYKELKINKDNIFSELEKEENRFRLTLDNGIRELMKDIFGKKVININKTTGNTNFDLDGLTVEEIGNKITGNYLFYNYSTNGFPLEMSLEEIQRVLDIQYNGKKVEEIVDLKSIKSEFEKEFKRHQELSRTASAGAFKGGLADGGEQTKRLHTATHLLLAALRQVLGNDVLQKGSNITPERLRFDFSYPEKMTPEQLAEVEKLVNGAIEARLSVSWEEMSLDEAKNRNAMGVFGAKYGEKVKVYHIANDMGELVSNEICGGPHAENTGELGHFKIKKEEASSAGVRRIKAVLE